MFGLSGGHLFILMIVVLVLFGAKRLPELGSSLGKGLRAFKKGLEGVNEDEPPRIDAEQTAKREANKESDSGSTDT